MAEVTAEMIERGRGADPNVMAERRRVAREVREAREKLTSTGSGFRAFDLEMMRLYAERRRAAAPGLALLGAGFAAVVMHWLRLPVVLTWFSLNAGALLFAHALAGRFLASGAGNLDLRKWRRSFATAEAIQGCAWAIILLLSCSVKEADFATLALLGVLLVAAMSATVTASIPTALYSSLAPITLATLIMLRPTGLASKDILLLALALGTQLYFVVLARKLHASAVQTLTYRVEKDELIAELEQSKANSDLARRRAEESNLAKSRFLATMSHELRTPLNAILGFSEVMKSELFGKHALPTYKEYAHDIHSSGEHLLTLINEILDLSRVEAGRYELHEESVDLNAVLDECRHLVTLRAQKKDIEIVQATDDALPRLWVDMRALRQVALNLLSNAIKFTPQGGQVTIGLGSTVDGGQFFSIRDTGAGIPEAEIPVVMASFGRGSLAQKNAEEGTGLGLPIVKGLVELHGGTFDLESKVREGTLVTVCFPAERVMSVLPHISVDEGPDAHGSPPLRAQERSAA